MASCIIHPDVPSRHPCALCAEPYCDACLVRHEPLGPICLSCEKELEHIPRAQWLEQLPTLREKVRSSLPAARGWWGWELFYWCVVGAPSLVAAVLLSGVLETRTVLSMIRLEPRLPAITSGQLEQVASQLEAFRQTRGHYPEQLDALYSEQAQRGRMLLDPYSPRGDALLYTQSEGMYRVCSVGPDRQASGGIPLDRFTISGDLCVGGRTVLR